MSDLSEDESADAEYTVPRKIGNLSLKHTAQVYDLDFHPTVSRIVTGLITGNICLHSYGDGSSSVSSSPCQEIFDLQFHEGACRSLLFSIDGSKVFSGSVDKTVAAVDATTGQLLWHKKEAHTDSVNCILNVFEDVFASGDDAGAVLLWDVRQKERVMRFHVNTDYISSMAIREYGEGAEGTNYLLATSGDATLSVFDLKQRKVIARSDDQEEELLSVCVVKNGKKVVCGSQNGVMLFFTAGAWTDLSDRFPGHPASIDSMLKIDESTVLTGSSDGLIRVIGVHPNKLLGVLGDHDNFPVEQLKMSHDRKLIGTCSHDELVRFWDASIFEDGDDDDDDEDDSLQNGNDSDDETGVGADDGSSSMVGGNLKRKRPQGSQGSPQAKSKRTKDDNDDGDDDGNGDDDDDDEEEEREEGDDASGEDEAGKGRKDHDEDDDDDDDGGDDSDNDSDNDAPGNSAQENGRSKLSTATERFFADL